MERNLVIKNIRKILFPIILVFILVFGACKPAGNEGFSENIRIIRKLGGNPNNIEFISEYAVPEYINDSISLDSLSIAQRKREFLNMMLPAVLAVKAKLDLNRERVLALEEKKDLTPLDKMFLDKLEKEYKTQNLKVLARRLRTFPVSIVLAQAAVESGWGTSRFFQEANNPFGIWAFNNAHARMEALSGRSGKKVYLRKFNNLKRSIEAYYRLLATGRAFRNFRKMKAETDQPLKLIQALNNYSERGSAYVNQLANLIISNNLQKYDQYEIGPQYLAMELDSHFAR